MSCTTAMSFKPPESFDFKKPDKWPDWRQRFLRYRLASRIDTESFDAQVSAMIYSMGADAEKIYSTFTIPRKPDGPATTFEDVVKLFDAHFTCQADIIYERAALNEQHRQNGNGPLATRSQVEELRENLREMSDKLDNILPRIAFARNGGVTLVLSATAFMFVSGVTLFPQGRYVAALLLAFGLLLQGSFFIFREVVGIVYSRHLLHEFSRIVPVCMTPSRVSSPESHGVFSLLMLVVDFLAFLLCLSPVTTATNIYLLLISLLLLFLAAIFVCVTIEDNNDYDFKITCLRCIKTLDTLLNPREEL